ncbi:hypothetical protein [Amycolatopsis sp. NPDC051071]|uniref:hypothetical protein n=1 Tax=Amycolatopsis sp. NPDC051071 TaxID=3154637 RepID=UPI0034345F80
MPKAAGSGWQVGVSQTVPVGGARVWDFLAGREGVEIWLGPGAELPRWPNAGPVHWDGLDVEPETLHWRESTLVHGLETLPVRLR